MNQKEKEAIYRQLYSGELRKADKKRLRLIESAIRIIAKKGLDGLTYPALAKSVSMSPPHVVYYFRNKEEILIAAAQYVMAVAQQRIVKRIESAQGWKDQIRAIVVANRELIDEYPDHMAFRIAFLHAATHSIELRKLAVTVRQSGFERLQTILSEPFKEWDCQPNQLPLLAHGVHNLITGWIVEAVVQGDLAKVKTKQLGEERTNAIFDYLRGALASN